MNQITGYISMILACLLYSLIPVTVKKYNVSLIYKIILIYLAIYIPSASIMFYYNRKNKKSEKFTILNLFKDPNRLTIGLLYSIYSFFIFYGFQVIPVSISLPIFMMAPLFIMFQSRIINNESFNILQLISAIIAFIGIIIVSYSKSKVDNNTLIKGIIAMFIGSFSYALSFVLLDTNGERKLFKYFAFQEKEQKQKRKYFEELHVQMINTSFIPLVLGIIVAVIFKFLPNSLIPLPYHSKTDNINDMIKLFIIYIVLGYVVALCYFYSFNNLPINTYGALENFEIIMSLFVGYFLLNEHISLQKIIGCIIVITGIILEILFKNISNIKSF